jgi:hypothetical protein
MADITTYYINGQLANPPLGYEDSTLQLNYDTDTPTQQVSFNSATFVRENRKLIEQFIQQYGVFVGIPFQKKVNNSVVFDGFIYLSQEPTLQGARGDFKIVEKQSLDWLNIEADNFDFDYLRKVKSLILPSDFKIIPYVIEKPVDYAALAVASLTVFVVAQELYRSIKEIAQLTASSANPFEATSVIRLGILIAYLIILLFTLIKLINDVVRLLIQPVKYHAGMTVKKHFEAACQHLGLNFSSSLLSGRDANAVILPEKFQLPFNNNIFGFDSNSSSNNWNGYYKGTFGDFLRAMKLQYNAKVFIQDGTLYFERKDFQTGQPQFVLAPIEDYELDYTYNTEELAANKIYQFQTDLSDNHTILEWQGTQYQIITQNTTLPSTFVSAMKGLEIVDFPFALGKRKSELSGVEKIFDAFYKIAGTILNTLIKTLNAIIAGINKIIRTINRILKALQTIGIRLNFQFDPIKPLQTSGFGNTISNRIGMLKLENDYFGVPKILILNAENKLELIQYTALEIYEKFYSANSFVPTTDRPNANQYIIYSSRRMRFKESDFLLLKNNKFCLNLQNEVCEVISVEWNDYYQYADISYKQNKLYDRNLIEYKNEPTGA